MKICVAVSEESVEKAICSGIDAANHGADIVEIRFDAMLHLPEDLSVFADIPAPLIATLRTKSQGGRCELSDAQRLDFFKKCKDYFAYIDLESDSTILNENLGNSDKIISYHDFSKTPSADDIVVLMQKLQKAGDIGKAAFAVNNLKDLYEIITASERLTGRHILIGMGELGEITRICCDEMGSEITYSSLEKGKETAPGQVCISTLKHLQNNHHIAGIIGNPVGHSKSPPMHNAAFDRLNINGRYLRFKCETDEIPIMIAIIKKLNMIGINVTIPHKQTIIQHLDKLDSTAESAGAVNCILNNGGQLIGMNTDIAGFRESFRAANVDVINKKSLIIGAGGAARACATFLVQGGADVYIINRTHSKAEALAKEFGGKAVSKIDNDFEIIINCTPIGMNGFQNESPYADEIFHKGQTVMDAVPVPKITPFLQQAQKNGAQIISGREMLIYQAIDAFEIWTNRKAEYSIMSDAYGE